jgi:RHS repeat-associated protein
MVRSTRTVVPLVPGNLSRTFETRSAYDSFGRMVALTYPDGERLAYLYDGGGQVTGAFGVRPPAPHSPAASETYLETIEYDEFGARVSMSLGNGVVSRYGYDSKTRRLSTLSTITPSGRALQLLQYTYDRVGDLTDLVNGLAGSTHHRSGPVAAHYQYDMLDRLVGARATADARPGLVDRYFASYAYSDIHNLSRNTQVRELLHGPNGSAELPPQSNHDYAYQYSPAAGPHQATAIGDLKLTYDENGNTSIQCRAHGGSCAGAKDVGNGALPASHDHWRRYDWTEENWLRQVVDGGGHVTRFLYDSSGDRVVKFGRGAPSLTIGQFFSVQGSHHATKHVFAGRARIASKLIPVAEEVALWGPAAGGTGVATVRPNPPGCGPSDGKRRNCGVPPGAGQPASQSATYYYHPDHLGSTSWMTDRAGRVHEHLEYFPYGDVWRDSKLDDDPGPEPRTPAYLFTGKEFDEETHLTYFGARYYDSRLARWVSNDPAVLRVDVHQPHLFSGYLYGQGSPVRYADPDGRSPLDIVFLVIDVASAIKDPSLTNLAFVALDVVTLATPLPSAGAVRAGVKGLQVLNKVHEAAEIASTTKKAVEAAHVLEETAHAAEAIRAAKVAKAAEEGGHAVEATAHAGDTAAHAGESAATKEGIVYKRTNPKTAESYVGQAKSSERFEARQLEHNRKLGVKHDYEILGKASPGKKLDVLEEKMIREQGGLQKEGGTLLNKRHQISEPRFQEATRPPRE